MKIGIIGGGNMSRAIILGLISNKFKADNIMVSDPVEKKLTELKRYGVKIGTNEQVHKFAEMIILAVKPNVYEEVLNEALGVSKLFVSVAAGVSLGYIKAVLGEDARVARVMPNTPALAGAGMTAVCRDGLTNDDLERVVSVFESLGKVLITEERLIDAVVGLSGSGPAYVFTMIEAMADGGVLGGLSRADALLLAAQTVFGSAKMLMENAMHPAELRDMVCSPGGTSIEGVKALESGAFRAAVISAVDAATKKSREISR